MCRTGNWPSGGSFRESRQSRGIGAIPQAGNLAAVFDSSASVLNHSKMDSSTTFLSQIIQKVILCVCSFLTKDKGNIVGNGLKHYFILYFYFFSLRKGYSKVIEDCFGIIHNDRFLSLNALIYINKHLITSTSIKKSTLTFQYQVKQRFY